MRISTKQFTLGCNVRLKGRGPEKWQLAILATPCAFALREGLIKKFESSLASGKVSRFLPIILNENTPTQLHIDLRTRRPTAIDFFRPTADQRAACTALNRERMLAGLTLEVDLVATRGFDDAGLFHGDVAFCFAANDEVVIVVSDKPLEVFLAGDTCVHDDENSGGGWETAEQRAIAAFFLGAASIGFHIGIG